MGKPDSNASAALDKSGLLMLFAAQTVSDPQQRSSLKTIAGDIESARDASAQSTWDSSTAAKFWGAYNDLCALIQPVNADTLETGVSPTKWFGISKPLPNLTATKYLIVLVTLLVVSVFLLALGSSLSSSVTAVQKLLIDGRSAVDQTSTLILRLQNAGVEDEENYANSKKPQTSGDISPLKASLAKQYGIGDDLYYKTGPWWSIVGLFSREWKICEKNEDPAKDYCYRRGDGGIADKLSHAKSNTDDYYLTANRASERIVRAQSISNIVAATFLSIILGMTGACAYIVRTIADQIRGRSFSSTSAIRHQVRLWLGALAGVAIGFGGFVTSTTLSAAALAFLAGYAIEPVFSTFDRIANSLK